MINRIEDNIDRLAEDDQRDGSKPGSIKYLASPNVRHVGFAARHSTEPPSHAVYLGYGNGTGNGSVAPFFKGQ